MPASAAEEDVPASEGVTEPDEDKPKGLSACPPGWLAANGTLCTTTCM